MGFIRSWFRKKFVAAMEYAIREEMPNYISYGISQTERSIDKSYRKAESHLLYEYKIQNQIASELFQINRIPYLPNERVRVIFLFQVASFWPAWESFYNACMKDTRIDAKLLLLEETVREHSQMETAREFLEEKHLPYISFEDFDIDEFQPHVVVLQTPYDAGHRIKPHWSSAWKSKGYRVVYIPYGIEISDTNKSREMHFEQHVIENAWRIYTFSERMLKDYRKYSINAGAVRCCGLPRFDAYAHKEDFELDESLKSNISGRNILLWKVHFPKTFEVNGKSKFVTPNLNEYIEFAHYISERQDIFCIFMPHPKFEEKNSNKNVQRMIDELIQILEDSDNVYIDRADDYRTSLVNANYIIVDRSAIMVEAGAMDVPVLYMRNEKYDEPLTQAIEPLINSYSKGTNCLDMIRFLEDCISEKDNNSEMRRKAFAECIPYFDGNAGERIKGSILKGVYDEVLENSKSDVPCEMDWKIQSN